jgi:hypothetical protein
MSKFSFGSKRRNLSHSEVIGFGQMRSASDSWCRSRTATSPYARAEDSAIPYIGWAFLPSDIVKKIEVGLVNLNRNRHDPHLLRLGTHSLSFAYCKHHLQARIDNYV